MSKANEWAQRDGETGRQWLRRLHNLDKSHFTQREFLLFDVRQRQAVKVATSETFNEQKELAEVDTVDLVTLKREKEAALQEDSPALVLAKDVYLCLSEDERRRFEAWQKAGCPNE